MAPGGGAGNKGSASAAKPGQRLGFPGFGGGAVLVVVSRLGGLPPVCGLALDVDGTITVERGSFLLDLGLAGLLRRLEAEAGIRVMLVTGNALPVVAGLGRYLGFSGPHVAENGCLVFHEGRVVSVCEKSTKEAAGLVEERLGGLVEPSWQNPYRSYDYAFRVRGGSVEEAHHAIRSLLDREGYGWVKLSYSGYAVHLRPPEASKGRGLSRALSLAGLRPGCTLAVGDSGIDAEMGEAGVLLAAVADADDELLERADIVLEGRGSAGVARLAKALLGSNP